MNNLFYAGIGSRKCPKDIFNLCIHYGKEMAKLGYCLTSGGAPGCDNAFEIGCDEEQGSKRIFLPWKGFNKNLSTLYKVEKFAYNIGKQFHPAWHKLSEEGKSLISRNSYQVLNIDLKSPVDLVICYTENGEIKGGTAQAIRISKFYNIPVYNLGLKKDKETLDNMIEGIKLSASLGL